MRPSRKSGFVLALSLAVLLVAALAVGFFGGAFSAADKLVVYCAHDSLYSEEILRQFERETGIPVSIRFDTEATKSLGLVNLLINEREHPRCDVFWNNQVLGTMDLKDQGILLAYKGTGYERIPDQSKDPEGYWTGFAARLRVYIVNTDRMAATEETVEQAMSGDLSRMAIAKPLYGTTLSHYSLLWHVWGGEELKQFHRDTHERGVREVAGNATVKNLVAAGTCDFGWTDSDDFFVAKDDGKPVAMLPIRVGGPTESASPRTAVRGLHSSTISIPNSVAIIRGTKRLAPAQKLVDFLLSAEAELALARSKARQIPLGPVDDAELPDEVRQLKTWAESACDLTAIGSARRECLRWLESEYLR